MGRSTTHAGRTALALAGAAFATGCFSPGVLRDLSDETGESSGEGSSGAHSAGASDTEADPEHSDSSSGDSTGDATGDGDPVPVGCGNGIVEPGEACDDGNQVDADGCNRDCAPSGQLVWHETIGGGENQEDRGMSIAVLDDATVAVAGYKSDASGVPDAWLRRYDADGDALVTLTHTAVGDGGAQIRSVVGGAEASLYAAGHESGPSGESANGWLRKYSLSGEPLWTATYNGPASSSDRFNVVVVDGSGDVVVGGYHHVTGATFDALVRKYSPQGDVLWSRSFAGPSVGDDSVLEIDVSAVGHLYVVGYNAGPAAEGDNAWVAKYDGDGNVIWTRTVNGAASLDDRFYGVRVVGEDEVVVSGYSLGEDVPRRAMVRRYDALGMITWEAESVGAASEGAYSTGVDLDLDGNIVVVGSEYVDEIQVAAVRKYTPDGRVLWSTLIPGGDTGPDIARKVAVGADNRIYVSGTLNTGVDAEDIWVAVLSP